MWPSLEKSVERRLHQWEAGQPMPQDEGHGARPLVCLPFPALGRRGRGVPPAPVSSRLGQDVAVQIARAALQVALHPERVCRHVGPGFKCPICSKSVASDEMEMHFIMCLSKPRLSYNDDVLTKDAGECVICLEELLQGDTIARLPCLCIYHKSCIDSWFEVNRSCPEHPSD
nr:PREDICTED: E3 ubiquitin-protein ligase ZNRF1 [Struthio camelus australis]